MRLHKLLVKEGEDGEYPSVVAVYSTIEMANRAKRLCPGSFLIALPLDYIPKGCPEGKQAYRVNVDCGNDGSMCTEQIDVFSVEGGFVPAEYYWIYPFEQRAGEMCLELWAKSKMDAEVSAWCCYERFKESFPDNHKGFFSPEEWETLLREGKVVRVGK